MAFNPNVINTSVPPPNYLIAPMQIQSHQVNSNPTSQIPRQHMFNSGLHVPPPAIPPFNASVSNHLQSPPPVALGFVHNPIHTSAPMWDNNTINSNTMNNQQKYNFPSAPPIPCAPNTQSLQVPPPVLVNQFNGSGWSNSTNNQAQNNHIGLLAIPPNSSSGNNQNISSHIQNFPATPNFQSSTAHFKGLLAPNSSSGNNQQNFNSHIQNFPAPAAPNFQSSTSQFEGLLAIAPNSSSGNNQPNFNKPVQNFTAPAISTIQSSAPQFEGNHNRNNPSVWSNNSFKNKSLRPPPLLNQSKSGNAWNPIQKTNVPDSSIFQNPNAIFNMTGLNCKELDTPTSDVMTQNFQDNTNMFSINQNRMNLTQNFNSLPNSFASLKSSSVPNFSESPGEYNRNFQNSNDFRNMNRFYRSNLQDSNVQLDNFKAIKPDYNEGQNQSFRVTNENLIDVHVAANKFERKLSNYSHFQSKRYCKSNSGSKIAEEYTVSDSESVESISSKSSPQKQFNNRFSENLQNFKSEFNEKAFQNKMGWMTDNIQKALKKRNMLFKQARATNDPSVWDEYNKLKLEINEEIKQSKLDARNNRPQRFTRNSKAWQCNEKKFPFNCDTCDKGFTSKGELDLHIALHITCHYSGCSFQAHPKIVELHQKMQHDTGYADVINKLQNDEEIKKWREERKRRFPTAENILKRKAEQAEREARGEVIEEKNFGQFKKRKFNERSRNPTSNRFERNNRWNKSRNPYQRAPEIDLAQDSDSDEKSEWQTTLPKFRGMKQRLEDSLNVIADVKIKEEDVTDKSVVQSSKVSLLDPVNSSSVEQEIKELDDEDAPLEIPIQKASLIESSDSADENDDEPVEVPIHKAPLDETLDLTDENDNKLSHKKDQQELEDETVVGNTSTTKPNTDEKSTSDVNSSLALKNDKGRKKERKERQCRPPVPPRPRNTLLRMLLSGEIRHERNLIMQCIRHIVKNNFFGIGANV